MSKQCSKPQQYISIHILWTVEIVAHGLSLQPCTLHQKIIETSVQLIPMVTQLKQMDHISLQNALSQTPLLFTLVNLYKMLNLSKILQPFIITYDETCCQEVYF